MSQPSNQEKELLIKFRERLEDVLKTKEQSSDPFLLRWLRARDLNMDQAESMLRNSLKWREEFDVDNILTHDFDPWIIENYPFWVEGMDKEGRPVVELPLGSWDMRKAIDLGKEEEFVNYTTFFFETSVKRIREMNASKPVGDYPISQIVIIVDWTNYSYGQLLHWRALQNILKMAAKYEEHYPEILQRCFFINCPSIFPLVMAMLKQILVPNTLKKITCHSTKKEWEPLVRELIDEDQLATFLGGTRTTTNGKYPY